MSPRNREKKLQELKAEMLNLRAKVAMGGVIDSPGRMREIRRTIARLHTVSRAKEIAETD